MSTENPTPTDPTTHDRLRALDDALQAEKVYLHWDQIKRIALAAAHPAPVLDVDALAVALAAAMYEADPVEADFSLADAILAALPDGWVLARRQDAEDGAARVYLHPCHVTGMHTPDHHLVSDHICGLQAEDIAKQAFGDLTLLPRALHPNCYWCGTRAIGGHFTTDAAEQMAWAEGARKAREALG